MCVKKKKSLVLLFKKESKALKAASISDSHKLSQTILITQASIGINFELDPKK